MYRYLCDAYVNSEQKVSRHLLDLMVYDYDQDRQRAASEEVYRNELRLINNMMCNVM